MTHRPNEVRPPRIRTWDEGPVLAEWVLAPLTSAGGVTVCEHLTTTDGTIDTLSAPAAYVPQVNERVLCRDCAATALDACVAAFDAGAYYPACAICREHPRPLTQWKTPRGAPFFAMAWICDPCSTAGAAP